MIRLVMALVLVTGAANAFERNSHMTEFITNANDETIACHCKTQQCRDDAYSWILACLVAISKHDRNDPKGTEYFNENCLDW